MKRDEFIKRLHPAITHISASDTMSEETLNAINRMVEKVVNMSPDELKRLAEPKSAIKTGIELIAEERQEQIEKHGWDEDHDSQHDYGELRKMAAVLCCMDTNATVDDPGGFKSGYGMWGLERKLANDKIHRLKVAGALIAAEIDRIQADEL